MLKTPQPLTFSTLLNLDSALFLISDFQFRVWNPGGPVALARTPLAILYFRLVVRSPIHRKSWLFSDGS